MKPLTIFEEATSDIALGELDAAIASTKSAFGGIRIYFDAWHALGMALMKAGRFSEAIRAGLRAVEIESERSTRVVQPLDFLREERADPRSGSSWRESKDPVLGGKIKQESPEA